MNIVAGIDVSKHHLDVCVLQNTQTLTRKFASTPEGIKALVAFVKKAEQVLMEATGNYHIACASALFEAGVRVCVVNPAQASYFAKARMRRNKTDKVDASLLAEMATDSHRAWEPDPPEIRELQGLLRIREDLVRQRCAKRAQLQGPGISVAEEEFFHSELSRLKNEMSKVDKALRVLLQVPALKAKYQLLLQVPGVGVVVAPAFLALLPSSIDGSKQAAAFCGLTPRRWESGKLRGQTRLSKQGNSTLRQLLYIAALSARSDGGPLQAFYDRLAEKLQSKKAALCALAHKLARIMWAVVYRGENYDPKRLTAI